MWPIVAVLRGNYLLCGFYLFWAFEQNYLNLIYYFCIFYWSCLKLFPTPDLLDWIISYLNLYISNPSPWARFNSITPVCVCVCMYVCVCVWVSVSRFIASAAFEWCYTTSLFSAESNQFDSKVFFTYQRLKTPPALLFLSITGEGPIDSYLSPGH